MDISSINKYIGYEKADWKVQRIAWILMGVVLVAGLLGMFGDSGGLLNSSAASNKGFMVEYDRFIRVENEFKMTVTVAGTKGACTISFNKDYLRKVKLSQVLPEPEEVEINDKSIIYTFRSLKGGIIIFYGEASRMGQLPLRLTINGSRLDLKQFIYF